MKKNAVIALLTDFGLNDGFVGSMKGVILSSLPPTVQIVDVTHSVEPQNIDEAAYLLWSVFNYFPKGTIFVCVVDPGVGSKRKILCLQTDRFYFLAPDNGLLKFILGSAKPRAIVAVTNRKYFAKEVSSTFHGRDIFAPVAAHLANGLSITKLGPKTKPLFAEEHFVEIVPDNKKVYVGKIIHIDHFGNIITNFHSRRLFSTRVRLQIRKSTISRFSKTYADAKLGHPFVVPGSSKLLEVSLKNGNVARFLDARINQKIRLRMV